eukprot:jgi/Bigna1/136276/aug1.33_g10984
MAMVFSALGVKTYRIYRIFTKTMDNISKLSDVHLIRLFVVPLAVITLLLATFALVITKLAYDAREAPLQYNEAKELGLSLYTAIISGIVGVALIAWLQGSGEYTALYVTIATLQCIPQVAMLLPLFAARLFYAIGGVSVIEIHQRASRGINMSRVEAKGASTTFRNGARSIRSGLGGSRRLPTSRPKSRTKEASVLSEVMSDAYRSEGNGAAKSPQIVCERYSSTNNGVITAGSSL